MIYFKGNEPTKRVSQKIGEGVIKAKLENGNVEIKGGLYDTVMIDRIVPINTDHGFDRDYVELSERAELANPEERKYLDQFTSLPQITDGE
jgi:hypothetical protein